MAMEEYKSVERSDSQAEKTAASVIASRLSAEAEEEFVDERLENDNDSRITRVKFPSAARFASLPTSESINSSNSQASPRSTSHSNENDNKITAFDAIVHLSKGNLGPGCLNLPHAFGRSGWLMGSTLFGVVAFQGIYSMRLLTECKQLLLDSGRSVHTFMDVAHVALGSTGHFLVQIFLFILQAGVCCVFLSLIATNMSAQLPKVSEETCIWIVTLLLCGIVWVKTLKHLRWFSATANLFMFTAIATSAIAATFQVVNLNLPLPAKSSSNFGDLAAFTSTMFFSFEGIGLVLPVENSFTVADTLEETSALNKYYRNRVLPFAMAIVATFFWVIGFFGSWGFPDIENGSITAYLAERYPDEMWFGLVNILVMSAVFLTFPLQLTPAMEVVEEWCGNRDVGHEAIPGMDSNENPLLVLQSLDNVYPTHQDHLLGRNETPGSNAAPFCQRHGWILRRYMIVIGCLLVVLYVNDLSLLISLFGAVGQTGLAAMPCLCHLALQRKGLAPKHRLKSAFDIATILFSGGVMIAGIIVTVNRIIKKQSGAEYN